MRASFAFLAAAALSVCASTSVMAAESLGKFRNADGSTDYQIDMCGPASADLCVTILQMYGPDAEKNNGLLAGVKVVDQAKSTEPGRWKGKMRLGDFEMDSTFTRTGEDSFDIELCAFFQCSTSQLKAIQ